MNTGQIELALAKWLNWRTHLIVPNVSWGLGLHECDLLCLSKSGFATEIEIKASVSDLKRDGHKRHHHQSQKIKFLYFAMSDTMLGHECEVPEGAGVIYVRESGVCLVQRRPTPNKLARKLSDAEIQHLGMLGTMRMWKMKAKEGK